MSEERSTQRPTQQNQTAMGPMRGPMGAMGRPVEKAKDFQGTAKRFTRLLCPTKISSIDRAYCCDHWYRVQHCWSKNTWIGNYQTF